MTKEELKQEAEEWLDNERKYLIEDNEGNLINISKKVKEAYLASAEPREKQIQIDAEQIRALQKQNGELTDELTKKADTNHQLVEQLAKMSEENAELKEKHRELEQQIEITAKSKDLVINNQLEEINMLKEKIKQLEAQLEQEKNLSQCRFDHNEQLREQIEKMKCCSNCNHFNKESDIEYCQNCERQLVNSLEEEIIKDEWELRR